MTPRALEHITITSGGTRMSSRSEVSDSVLRAIRDAISARAPLHGWRIHMPPSPGAMRGLFDLAHDSVVIAHCALCSREEESDALWEIATGWTLDDRVTLHRPRGVPWLAAGLTIEALQVDKGRLFEAGDLERCVARALLS